LSNSSSDEVPFASFQDTFSDDFFQNSPDNDFDPSIYLPQEYYCERLSELKDACWESNLAELWNYNASVISSLTQADIINTINSGSSRYAAYKESLGKITRQSGKTEI
jgi:hypothetical protein